MRLLLTRHGQSRWQTEGSIAGGDSPLSPLGELQAHRLGVHLKRYETVDRIVASHLKRAHKTATIVASYLEMDLTVNPQLREFESDAAGRAPLPSSFWNPEPVEAPNPDHQDFLERVRGALCEILPDEEADEIDDETLIDVLGRQDAEAVRASKDVLDRGEELADELAALE